MTDRHQHAPQRVGPATVALLALLAALVTGYGEVLILTFRSRVAGEFIHRGPDYAWVTPLAYLILFTVPGIFITALAARAPRLMTVRRAAFLLAFGVFGSWILMLGEGKLHIAALALLAIGLAAQASSLLERRWDRMHAIARNGVVMLGGLTLALSVLLPAGRELRERRALASLPPASGGAPNVLLLILDTVRASSLSLYGYHRHTTPNLDRWAQRGVVFDRAIATAPWTLPSHASLFTGLPPNRLRANWLEPLEEGPPALAGQLRDGGWATAGFVANQLYAGTEHGLARGFVHYDVFPFSTGLLARAAFPMRRILDSYRARELVGNDELIGRRRATEINARFMSWMKRLPSDRPFFAFLNYFDAHDPYLPDPDDLTALGFRQSYIDRLSPLRRLRIDERRDRMSAEDIRIERERYEAAIRGLDRDIGALLDSLDRRGVLNRTIVIITSDHGEEFGEHDAFYHGHTVNAQALWVPLMITYPPEVPQGRRVTTVVSLVDVAATALALSGQPASLPGESLARWWTATSPDSGVAFSSVRQGIRLPAWYPGASGDLWSVMAGGTHLIQQADGKEFLYRWLEDQDEARNLIADSAAAPIPGLRNLMTEYRSASIR